MPTKPSPQWDNAPPPPDWAKLDRTIQNEVRGVARSLEVDWGRGGPQGIRAVKKWDKEFRLLMDRIVGLHNDGHMTKETESVVLDACAAILALEDVPHWDHVEDIQVIRETLNPAGYYGDYPEASDDDEPA